MRWLYRVIQVAALALHRRVSRSDKEPALTKLCRDMAVWAWRKRLELIRRSSQ